MPCVFARGREPPQRVFWPQAVCRCFLMENVGPDVGRASEHRLLDWTETAFRNSLLYLCELTAYAAPQKTRGGKRRQSVANLARRCLET